MRIAFAVVPALLALASPAAAASPEEDLVRGWLEGMSFGAPVAIDASSWDPANRSVELDTITIGRPGGALVLILDRVTVEAPRKTSTGRFAALSIRASGIDAVLKFDPEAWFPELVAFEKKQREKEAAEAAEDGQAGDPGTAPPPPDEPPVLTRIEFHTDAEALFWERVELPMRAPEFGAAASLTEVYVGTIRWLAEWRAEWAEATNIRVSTRGAPDGADTTVTYDRYFAAGMHDGRVERLGFTGSRQTEKVDGTDVTATIAGAEAIGLDSSAMLEVLDPAAFAGGTGDGRWRDIIQAMTLHDVKFEAPDFAITMGVLRFAGMRARQAGKPILPQWEAFLRDPGKVEQDPVAFMNDMLPSVFGLYGLDSMTIEGIAMSAAEGVAGGIEAIEVTRADSEGIGAVTLHGISMSAAGAGTGRLELLTFNDIRFGSLASWIAMAEEAAATGTEEPSPEAIRRLVTEGMPALRFVEMSGLSVESPDLTLTIDNYSGTSSDYLGQLARRTDGSITGFVLPVSAIPDPATRDQLAAMGYDRIALSAAFSARWDSGAGKAYVEDLVVRTEDMGVASVELAFGNLPLSLLDDPDKLEERFREATLDRGRIVFGNLSIVERIFEQQAKPLNQDPVQFRKNFGGGIPLMLGFLGDQELQKRLAPPLRAFFEDPKSLVLTLKPAAPVPFGAFEGMEDSPGALARLLGATLVANE